MKTMGNCPHGICWADDCGQCELPKAPPQDASTGRANDPLAPYRHADGSRFAHPVLPATTPCPIPDHSEAAALMLERVTRALRNGMTPEDIGGEVVLIGRMMERRT